MALCFLFFLPTDGIPRPFFISHNPAMSSANPSPSLFPRNAPLRTARNVCERWLTRLSGSEFFDPFREPSLLLSYVCDGLPPSLSFLGTPVSALFDGEPDASSEDLREARNQAIRLLSVAVKAHFFLFKADVLAREPFLFWAPELSRPGRVRYALCYPLLKSQRSVVVSEADLSLLAQGRLSLGRFPVVLPADPARWLDFDLWARLENEAREARISRDTSAEEQAPASAEFPAHSFPLGLLLDVPSEMRALARAAGLRFSDAYRSFYLPKGFDSSPVVEWLDFHRQRLSEAKELSVEIDDGKPS